MNRCEHGIYISDADLPSGKSWGCNFCYPEGHPETTQAPILPESSGDPLGRDRSRKMCAKCGNMRTYYDKACVECGEPFPEEELRGKRSASGGKRLPGCCKECGSTIHYETKKKSIWCCADCGSEYKAPMGRSHSGDSRRKGVDGWLGRLVKNHATRR